MASAAKEDIESPRISRAVNDKWVLDSFERDIEDAIFETVDADTSFKREPIFGNVKDPLIKRNKKHFVSNQNVSDQGHHDAKQKLSVFSKADQSQTKKPILSQLLLTFAVCAVCMALLYPMLLFVIDKMGVPAMSPDTSVLTGSTDSTDIVKYQNTFDNDTFKTFILDEPKPTKAANEGHVVRIDRGSSAGSIIYINPN